MTRVFFPTILLFVFAAASLAGQSGDAGLIDAVSWDVHFAERTAEGDQGPGALLVASETSDIIVRRYHYEPDRIADVYVPEDFDNGGPRGAVILVSGDSDSHARAWCGRALKDTDQYLQWGQVIAEHNLVAITYELGNPQNALETVTAWTVENAGILGIDPDRICFFSTNENGCTTGMETIILESRYYSGPKPAAAVFYYGLLPLRSSKQVYLDVPVMTVLTRDYMYRGMPESMEKFNARLERDGAMLTALRLPRASHWFDCKEDTPEARDAIEQTILFMTSNLD